MGEKNYYEQTEAQFKIRLPHELKDKIRQSADQHNRTMTADIVARLEQSFSTQLAPKAHYYTQKAYGLIYVAHGLESRISNIKFLLKTLTEDAQIQKYQLMLDMAQHDYEQVKIRLADALDIITDSGAPIDAELTHQACQIANKKPTV